MALQSSLRLLCVCCPGRTRTPTDGTKNRCPAIRRPGNSLLFQTDADDMNLRVANQEEITLLNTLHFWQCFGRQ